MAQPQLLLAPSEEYCCRSAGIAVPACSSSVKWSEFKEKTKQNQNPAKTHRRDEREAEVYLSCQIPRMINSALQSQRVQRRQQQATQGSDLVSCSVAVIIASLTTSLWSSCTCVGLPLDFQCHVRDLRFAM